ncbi:TPR repeat containing exported protein; Putative periplasmic protein contains a protein prenylyltransferase domain [hydrothermal vent metagenome]|uniref:TPR repeat containing exported protein Putative periplasmic protein contains a protein prenylyltransferase domain n=1 Tax=hydrothermal vent metagenome TaxID=652676 RepID=A0A3B0V7W1_9ZZZZ
MKKNILIFSALIGLSLNSVYAKKLSIQQRLAKLEKIINQQTDNRTNAADMVVQNQTLQKQIAQLKGTIEEQNHKIQSLQDKQKLLYIDIDSRLAELESKTKPANDVTSQSPDTTTPDTQIPSVEVDTDYNSIATTNITDEPTLSSAQDAYDIAFAHLRAGRFLESARAFESFIQNHPKHELTDNAYYWLGESYYVKRQYPQALAAFQTLTSTFPASSKAPDSWLKIGYSYYEMDDFVKAEENLQKVIDSYPEQTSIVKLAKNRLRQLQRDH